MAILQNKPEFQAIFSSSLKELISIFEKYGYKNELRIVGGAVRDILLDKVPQDLDLATTITPDEMKIMFTNESIKMINDNGEKHGTITARICTEDSSANFEITTLRKDVITDGRHAIIEFTKDWREDAARRDLTINALYLDFDGIVYDYFNSIADLRAHRILFVGIPSERIREDYLRILRYFRFFGRIASDPASHDKKTLKAIQDNVEGLKMISGERIWAELSKIVTGKFANAIMKKMVDLGMSSYLGLPICDRIDYFYFDTVSSNSITYQYHPVTFIASLLKNPEDVITFHERVHLSCNERDMALFLVKHKYDELSYDRKGRLRYFERLSFCSKGEEAAVKNYILELMKMKDQNDILTNFKSWKKPKLPVTGTTIMKKGVIGRQIGIVLERLRDLWIDNDYTLDENMIDNVISQFQDCRVYSSNLGFSSGIYRSAYVRNALENLK